MNRSIGDIYIAGSLGTEDWKTFRQTLISGSDPEIWAKAFADYFYTRLSLTYLNPITWIMHSFTVPSQHGQLSDNLMRLAFVSFYLW
jgi:hypothetical protein